MQHVIARRFWSFLFNRRQCHRFRTIEKLRCLCFLPLWILRCFQDYIWFLKFIGLVPGFSCFVRNEWFVPTGFRSLLLENWLDHFLLFIFQFSTGMFKTIKVTLQTNKANLIIHAIFWLYMWTFIMLNLDHKYIYICLITSYLLFIYSLLCYHTSAKLEWE